MDMSMVVLKNVVNLRCVFVSVNDYDLNVEFHTRNKYGYITSKTTLVLNEHSKSILEIEMGIWEYVGNRLNVDKNKVYDPMRILDIVGSIVITADNKTVVEVNDIYFRPYEREDS